MGACLLAVQFRDDALEVPPGHEAVVATSIDDALAKARLESVAVALVGARAAEADGFALVRRLRAAHVGLPVFVVGHVDDVVGAYEAGALDVVPSSARPEVLRAKVERAMELHAERRQLEASNLRLHALVDAAPVGLAWSTDGHGDVVDANPRLAELFELDVEGNVSATAQEPTAAGRMVRYYRDGREIAPEDLPLQRARREDRPVHGELEVRNPTGREWVAEVFGAPVHDRAGDPIGAVAIVLDTTERRRVDRALRASERRFRELADSVPQLVWTATPSGTVDYYNTRRSEYAGITQLPDGTWRWDTIVHPEDIARTVNAWTAALEHGEMYVCEHRIKMVDGTYRWHLSRGRPVRDEATGATRWFGTATDIHETKEIEARLRENEARLVTALDDAERAMKARDRLASAVSHDLKNPLATIVTQVGLLRMLQRLGASDPEKLEHGFARMERSAAKMTRMLDELLDAARLAAGEELELEPGRVDLREVCEQVARDQQAGAPRHRIEVVGKVAAEVVGEWDRSRLERVVDNLVSNAVKYSPDGGLVELQIDDAPGLAILRVRDEGVGIPPEDRDGIFRWFGRGQGAPGVRGTGIGLAGARQIVLQHGGSLRVDSEPGHGSTFTLSLPLARSSEALPRVIDASGGDAPPIDTENLLSALLRVDVVGLAVIDARTGHFAQVNRRLEELTGYGVAELRERTFWDITHPDDRTSDRAKWAQLASGGIAQLVSEKRYVTKDGRITWALVNAAPIWQGGRIARTVALIQDITALKESERRLAEAVRIREEFLTTASHELRTPLAALTLQLGTLRRAIERARETNGAGEPMKPLLAKVGGAERSSERLALLVDDLLDVSRLAREPLRLRRDASDLAEVVGRVLDQSEDEARRAGSPIARRLESVPGTWDVSRLSQAIRHLLTNAIRFGARSPIEVTLRRLPDGGGELRVVDRGTGIAAEDRERLFRPFERHASSAHYGGLGLGLYVVKRVVDAHGGSVDVSSAPGAGTAFTLRLPRDEVQVAGGWR